MRRIVSLPAKWAYLIILRYRWSWFWNQRTSQLIAAVESTVWCQFVVAVILFVCLVMKPPPRLSPTCIVFIKSNLKIHVSTDGNQQVVNDRRDWQAGFSFTWPQWTMCARFGLQTQFIYQIWSASEKWSSLFLSGRCVRLCLLSHLSNKISYHLGGRLSLGELSFGAIHSEHLLQATLCTNGGSPSSFS